MGTDALDRPRRGPDTAVDDPSAQRHRPGVLGLGVVDYIEKEDYENAFVSAVEAAIAEHGKLRLVYVLGHEYKAEAVREDVKRGQPTSR